MPGPPFSFFKYVMAPGQRSCQRLMISADKSVEPSSTAMTRMLSLNMVWL